MIGAAAPSTLLRVWRFPYNSRFSFLREFPHGVGERRAEHFRVEVNCVAGQIAVGPAPVRRLEHEAAIKLDLEVAGTAITQSKSAAFQ